MISMELTVHGHPSEVTFEIGEEDTPSSIALDLIEELELDPSADALKQLVATVEAAMARASRSSG